MNQLAICVKVLNVTGGFDLAELNELLGKGYTVNDAFASSDNALLVILDQPKGQA